MPELKTDERLFDFIIQSISILICWPCFIHSFFLDQVFVLNHNYLFNRNIWREIELTYKFKLMPFFPSDHATFAI